MSDEILIGRCLDNCQNTIGLTVDKKYIIKGEIEEEYLIENDNGYENYYLKTRFEIIEEDKNMKEYSLQEVINNIEDEEEYKSDSPIWEIKSIKKVNGNINFIYNGAKNDSVGVNANQRFIKVEKLVSFTEAITSGKRIKVDITEIQDKYSDGNYCVLNYYWNNTYFEISKILEMLKECNTDERRNIIILEGKWYVKED